MIEYKAPVKDLLFAAVELAELEKISRLPGFEDATPDLLLMILQQADKFAQEILAPLNRSGDLEGTTLDGQGVKTAEGWTDAYKAFIEAGWNGLPFDPERGGQGLPWLISTVVQEIWQSANMSFALCPLLTQAAIEAIEKHGSEQQKDTYLEKLISGRWAGTMNLTEPQAGSDLGAIKTRAIPDEDHYLITGQKIFITYGDHDLTENIIHLVLARTPNAPEGVKGISLFIVPKYLQDEQGGWHKQNAITTVSLEKKLGIHASPTAVLAYGGEQGAVGYLVGEENKGLTYMFTMMNLARHAIGVQANGIAERAYQHALSYASERVQGKVVGQLDNSIVTIDHHPDVKRLLLVQKARIEAQRGLSIVVAAALDYSQRVSDDSIRSEKKALVEVLIPVVKGYCSEQGLTNCSMALQIFGGMGFIEETGAAQFYRDARITTIYEGTTAIQANDLVGRKLLLDKGKMARLVINLITEDRQSIANNHEELAELCLQLEQAINKLTTATDEILKMAEVDRRQSYAVSVPYLMLWGTITASWQMLRSAGVACARIKAFHSQQSEQLPDHVLDESFYLSKIRTATIFFKSELPSSCHLFEVVCHAGSSIIESPDADLHS